MIAGLVIAVLVIGLLAYVLWALRAGGAVQRLDIEEQDGTTLTTVVVHSSKKETDATDVPVSTPLLRAAARHKIAMASKRAIRRRRLGMIFSLVVSAGAAVAACIVPAVSIWWLAAVPGILIAWMVLTRFSVRVVGRHLATLLADVERGNEEPTKLIAADVVIEARPAKQEMSVDLTKPVQGMANRGEPLPVSPPTYVSQPTLPRSVRRVDLSSLGGRGRFPVDASSPQDELPFFGDAPAKVVDQSEELLAVVA